MIAGGIVENGKSALFPNGKQGTLLSEDVLSAYSEKQPHGKGSGHEAGQICR